MESVGAVVLAGGSAVRMDGVDKAGIEVGGTTLLEHVLAAVSELAEVVVVGDQVPTSRPVTFTREDPAGGGPAAGLIAGLRAFSRLPDLVVTLAVDLPRVTRETVRRVVDAAAEADGAVLLDATGRRQHLCAAYRTEPLLSAAGSHDPHGLSMHRLTAGLALSEVAAVGDEARDVDTWADLRDLRQ